RDSQISHTPTLPYSHTPLLPHFCYTSPTMARTDESIFDKAEALARRVLERLGSRVDDRLVGDSLSARKISELASQIERAIESDLKEDSQGVKRIAPSVIRVLLTHEEASSLGAKYKEALGAELSQVAREFINNRRYETIGPAVVEIASDLFAKKTVIKTAFDSAQKMDAAGSKVDERTITLVASDGRSFRIKLKANHDPVYIGRASGIAARIDDASISRLHCSLALRTSGEIVISDLGSSNGSALNGRPLAPHQSHAVQSGDIVELGDVRLTITDIV
ncbi:MAG: FHA domain-containing protein, partial [Acidobacteriota bacterium]